MVKCKSLMSDRMDQLVVCLYWPMTSERPVGDQSKTTGRPAEDHDGQFALSRTSAGPGRTWVPNKGMVKTIDPWWPLSTPHRIQEAITQPDQLCDRPWTSMSSLFIEVTTVKSFIHHWSDQCKMLFRCGSHAMFPQEYLGYPVAIFSWDSCTYATVCSHLSSVTTKVNISQSWSPSWGQSWSQSWSHSLSHSLSHSWSHSLRQSAEEQLESTSCLISRWVMSKT